MFNNINENLLFGAHVELQVF